MPSNYILWGLVPIAILALLWLLYYWLPRFAANFDLRCRFQVVKRFMEENPQSAEETKNDYMRNVHWAVLQQCGLPPLAIVKIWLSSNKPYILAPADQIERYMIENEGKPLPDGKLDQRITNGQGRMILKLLWSLEVVSSDRALVRCRRASRGRKETHRQRRRKADGVSRTGKSHARIIPLPKCRAIRHNSRWTQASQLSKGAQQVEQPPSPVTDYAEVLTTIRLHGNRARFPA